ncbi:MAG: metallophosphoesterase [Elusimicrobiota bacterium]|nr:metallophosphoesterase [Elusimicrobiota bacterium]
MKNPFHIFGFGLALFYLAFNIYIAVWLAFRLRLGPKGRFIVFEAALLLSAFYPAVRTFAPAHFGGIADVLLWLALFGFGASFIFFWVLLVCDLALAALKALGVGWARGRPAAAAALALAAGFLALAAWHGAEVPRPKRVEVMVKGLPRALDGFTIIQISDLHLGRMIKLERLEKIADTINELRPDLVVFTGDFSESREPKPEGTCGVVKGMYSRYGKAAVLGNHDMFTGVAAQADFFEACGVKMLRGSSYEPAPGLVVAGVDDLRRAGGGAVKKLAASLDRSKPLLFLSHQPQGFDEITAAGSGLVLAGHTHAGQIFPFGPLERGMFKYFYGLYKAGDFSVYVTSGAGAWGPPLRLFADAELPLFVLRSRV